MVIPGSEVPRVIVCSVDDGIGGPKNTVPASVASGHASGVSNQACPTMSDPSTCTFSYACDQTVGSTVHKSSESVTFMGASGTGTHAELLTMGGVVLENCVFDVTVTKN
jgi:hypothetical protein